MNTEFHTPARRIALALGLSLLAHAVILWLPYMHLPRAPINLPPLSARLEPLPEPEKKVEEEPETEKLVTQTNREASSMAEKPVKSRLKKMARSAGPLEFPEHLRLVFAVYKGGGTLRSGEVLQQMDVRGDRYTLKSVRQNAGLSGAQRVRTSYGSIGEQGLLPDIYEEENIALSGRQGEKVTFRRGAGELQFSQGGTTALPDDAQDALSFMYQLSQISMQQEFFPLPVSDGAGLAQWQIEIGGEESISAPLGKLRTLHLRKMHEDGEPYFEIWLGLEYRLLPVKFRRVDASGKAEEWRITDIRTSGE